MNIGQMKIATKLWSFIIFIVFAICMAAGIGLIRSSAILNEGRLQQDTALELVQLATEWNGLTSTNAARNTAILLSSGNDVSDTFKDIILTTSNQITEIQTKIEKMAQTDADKAQLKKIADIRKVVLASRAKARDLKKDGKEDEATQVFKSEYLPAMETYLGEQKRFIELQRKNNTQIQTETETKRLANTTGILISLGIIVVLIIMCTLWLVRSIRVPLNLANDLAARIAEGDLTHSVHSDRTDEFGQLLNSLEAMNISLGKMVSEIRGGTDNIAIASAEIATGNNDLAQRTEQTSSNLQSTASSMDNLTQMVQHSTDNARQASSLTTNASSVAVRGGEVVTQVIRTMQEIDASSKKISDIISVIDGIAFQTNILALNAAVEAARAGEQGRGFAVVASEVRSLAGRSAEAAKEIKLLINTSVEKVASGTKLVTDAGSTMNEIVESVQRVADVVGKITAAANEQSTGIAGVNQAIGNLDQMTQQNAALVEESAAAAESLREQADKMKQSVAVFKVTGNSSDVSKSVLAKAAKPVKTTVSKFTAVVKPQVTTQPKSTIVPQVNKPVVPVVSVSKSIGADDDWETF